MRFSLITNQSVAGNSRPSCCFKDFRSAISKAGIGVFHDHTNRYRAQDNQGNGVSDRRLDAQDIFTPEDLSDEHLAVGRMVDEFWANEVEPNLPAIREKKPGVAMSVLRKSVELGLTAMAIPE